MYLNVAGDDLYSNRTQAKKIILISRDFLVNTVCTSKASIL